MDGRLTAAYWSRTLAYDEALAERIRGCIGPRPGITERKMFGGIVFMNGGRIFIGVMGDEALIRVGAEGSDAALSRPGVRLMDFAGRVMTGFVVAEGEAIRDEALQEWVDQTYEFAAALPPPAPKTRPARKTQR